MCCTSQLWRLGTLQGFPSQAGSGLWHQVTTSLTLCYASSASWFTEEEIGLGCYHIPAPALPFGCSGTLIMKEVLVLLLYNCTMHNVSLNVALSEFLLVFTCSLKRDSILNQTTEHSPTQGEGSAWAGVAPQELLQEVSDLVHLLPLVSELGVANSEN